MSVFAFAHPHVWLESDISITKDTIDIKWTFDEMFSSIVFSDFDINEDKKILGDEVKEVENNMFQNLSNFSYFTTVICGKKNRLALIKHTHLRFGLWLTGSSTASNCRCLRLSVLQVWRYTALITVTTRT